MERDDTTTDIPTGAPTGEDALTTLDQPLDDTPLAERLARPARARSTTVLLALLVAVVLFGGGALVGRATAPDTGPGSVPPTAGVVTDVTGGQVTVRSPDGTQTVLRTTPGTIVAVPRPGPVAVGDQVTVTGERGTDGALTATRVDRR